MDLRTCREKQSEANLKHLQADRWKTLTRESTVELARRIVEDSDRLALKVLLETRTLFRLKNGRPLLLPQFLVKLRDRMAPPKRHSLHQVEMADCVYDATLLKYSNFPDLRNKASGSLRGAKVDCRNYYRAFLFQCRQRFDRYLDREQR